MGDPVKHHPLIFTGDSVRALLAGNKTQTRRIIRPQPEWREAEPGKMGAAGWAWDGEPGQLKYWPDALKFADALVQYARWQPGSQIWVKEAFAWIAEPHHKNPEGCLYRSDGGDAVDEITCAKAWKPPRLEVVSVRPERLQEISEDDALAEGVECIDPGSAFGFRDYGWKDDPPRGTDAATSYLTLWEQIHGPDAWDKNSWVWAITFKRVDVA